MQEHLENPAIADRLESFATLLELSGAGYYTARAYRRAADLIRSSKAPVADLVRAGRVRELRGIGPGIEARLRELVETGTIAEVDELERAVSPELVGLGRYLGFGPSRAMEIGKALGVRTAAELREAAAAGRLREVPGIGAKTEQKLKEALARADAPQPPRRAMLLNRARSLLEGIAEALGGEVAGDPRRWRDTCERFAVVCSSERPAEVLERFARLPEICHTTWSDGKASVLEMASAARELGYEYLAICDHTPNVRVVPGLDADAVRRQGEEIAAANEALAPFRVLCGIECDILYDGRLDLPDDVLDELDWVQASVHAGQRTPRRALTERVLEALHNPAVRCLSHPKGRIINHRPENALDLEEVFAACFQRGIAIEVNGLPDRLDLRDVHVRLAVESGVAIVCSTDAHSVRGLGNMALAVATAGRGWARAENVLNSRPLAEVLQPRC